MVKIYPCCRFLILRTCLFVLLQVWGVIACAQAQGKRDVYEGNLPHIGKDSIKWKSRSVLNNVKTSGQEQKTWNNINMNLVKYNIDSTDPNIYIDELDLPAFLNFLGNEKEIVLSDLFGYTGDKYFSKNDFPPKMTSEAFLKAIESLKISNIKDLVFQSEGYRIVVDDSKAYHINADASLISNMLKEIFKKILLVEEFYQHIKSFQDLYLLFDNGRLVDTFETFDQLESEYN